MKFDNLYGNVPEEMHDKLQATLMGLPAAEEKAKNIGISPKRFSPKRLTMIVVAAVMCLTLTVTAVATGSFIKSLFQREQELIDPHSVFIDEQDKNNGLTLAVEKIAEDEDLIYVYYKLHSDEPFETGYLIYDHIDLGEESNGGKGRLLKRAYVEDAPNAKYALLTSVFLAEIKEPTCDIDGVLEMEKASLEEYITTDSGREVSRKKNVPWRSGRYHFAIHGLAVVNWIPDENGEIDKVTAQIEKHNYANELDVAFDFDVNDLENLPSTIWYPDSEFSLDGYTFKVKEIKQTAKNLWVTIASETDNVIEIEDQHFNPLMMFMRFYYSNEFSVYDSHTGDEIIEFYKIYQRNKLWERSYSFGVRVNGETDEMFPDGKYSGRIELREGGYDVDTYKLRFIFNEPIYTEDIEGIYVYNELWDYPIDEKPEVRKEFSIWEKK